MGLVRAHLQRSISGKKDYDNLQTLLSNEEASLVFPDLKTAASFNSKNCKRQERLRVCLVRKSNIKRMLGHDLPRVLVEGCGSEYSRLGTLR
ncbi:hypothetical protein NC652_026874 [Populus alba x Populus x berolinensis]|nr:hypothetical protein NC652_026874 [Populus alba x Populus x berolinensis]